MARSRGLHNRGQEVADHRPPTVSPACYWDLCQRFEARSLRGRRAERPDLVTQQVALLAQVSQDGVAFEWAQGRGGRAAA